MRKMKHKFLDFICCPCCGSEIEMREDFLLCRNCLSEYSIRNDIPIMIPQNKDLNWIIEAKNYADMADNYFKKRIDDNSGWWLPHKNKYKELLRIYDKLTGRDIVSEFIGSNFKDCVIVDFGGGDGFVDNDIDNRYRQNNYTFIITDISNAIQTNGKNRYNKDNFIYVTCSVEKIPLKNKITDVVFSTEALEHVKNPSGFFESASKILRKRGYLILTTPNKNSFILWWDSWGSKYIKNTIKKILGKTTITQLHRYGLIDTKEEGYERFLSTKEIKNYLEDYGFVIKKIIYTKFLGESIFGYWEKLKLPVSLLRYISLVVIKLEQIFNKFLPRFLLEFLGFTQIIIAQKGTE